MPRPSSGQVIEKRTRGGVTFALRFRAYGERHYVTLGDAEDGWTRRRAQVELENVLADVRRGIWRPPQPEPPVEPPPDPTFHEFASAWIESRRGELRGSTLVDYEWQLCSHLLPFFARHRLSQITVAEVDRYREAKVKERRIGGESINKTLTRLGQILDVAEERDLIARNPMRVNPRRRKLKVARPQPVHLESADQISALLQAAGEIDARAVARTSGRRPLVAALVFAGLRVGEACALRWRDIDLAGGRLYVRASKTSAGIREVELLPALRDELAVHKATSTHTDPDDIVFCTATGSARDKDNVRAKVIRPVVLRADELLVAADRPPTPTGLSAHKLRHTFASLLAACGEDPAHIMGQLGHTDPKFTLRVYTHAMRRGDGERDRLRALVEAVDWAPMGTNGEFEADPAIRATSTSRQNQPDTRDFSDGRGWFRTSDLSRVKRALSR